MVIFMDNWNLKFWKDNIAKKYNLKVKYDAAPEELSKAFKEIASYADVLIGNEEDFQLALGVKGPEAGGKNISSQIESFKGMIIEAHKAYPNVKVFATTLREVISANRHLWGAISYSNGEFYYIEPKESFIKTKAKNKIKTTTTRIIAARPIIIHFSNPGSSPPIPFFFAKLMSTI